MVSPLLPSPQALPPRLGHAETIDLTHVDEEDMKDIFQNEHFVVDVCFHCSPLGILFIFLRYRKV